MARKKKKQDDIDGAAWIVTFTDLMTLLLTFFVLLVSMAVVDERRKLIVLRSVEDAFGIGMFSANPLAMTAGSAALEQGPLNNTKDLSLLKPLLWDDRENDLSFESNAFVQVLSVNHSLLFEPGKVTISEKGELFLQQILPILKASEYPLLLGGHASFLRDEFGTNYSVNDEGNIPDLTWKISLARVVAIYEYFVKYGVLPKNLRMEAFGSFQPRFSTKTWEDRRKNRTVDIVLDKRASFEKKKIEEIEKNFREVPKNVDIDGFKFTIPGDL